MMRRAVLGLAAVLGAALCACGGGAAEGDYSGYGDETSAEPGAPSGPVNRSGGDEVVARMGPAGGRLELANGARVEIPPGCIEGAQDIIFKNAPRTTAFKDADVRGDKAVGPIVLVSPAVYAPEGRNIVVSIPFGGLPEGYSGRGLYLATEVEPRALILESAFTSAVEMAARSFWWLPVRFLARVDDMVRQHGYCCVAVSEGVRDAEGKFLADNRKGLYKLLLVWRQAVDTCYQHALDCCRDVQLARRFL